MKEAKKGIPYSFKLNMKDFKQALYEDNKDRQTVVVRSLRLNKERHMTRTTMLKSGLSDIHCKTGVQNDRVSCSPLEENGVVV